MTYIAGTVTTLIAVLYVFNLRFSQYPEHTMKIMVRHYSVRSFLLSHVICQTNPLCFVNVCSLMNEKEYSTVSSI